MPIYHLRIFFFFIVGQAQLSLFSPHHGPPSHPFLPPTLEPTPFGFVHVCIFFFFYQVPFQIFPCLNTRLFVFLLMNFQILYILDTICLTEVI